jgi:hypothetical protein
LRRNTFGHPFGWVLAPLWRLAQKRPDRDPGRAFFARRQSQPCCDFAVTHGWKSWIGFADQPSDALGGAVHVLATGGTDDGIMRFLWNMPTAILFFNYKIASVCGILIGTGNYKLSEVHDDLCLPYRVRTPDARRTARG